MVDRNRVSRWDAQVPRASKMPALIHTLHPAPCAPRGTPHREPQPGLRLEALAPLFELPRAQDFHTAGIGRKWRRRAPSVRGERIRRGPGTGASARRPGGPAFGGRASCPCRDARAYGPRGHGPTLEQMTPGVEQCACAECGWVADVRAHPGDWPSRGRATSIPPRAPALARRRRRARRRDPAVPHRLARHGRGGTGSPPSSSPTSSARPSVR